MMNLSVVIPVYNERDNVEALHARVQEVLRPLGQTYEIIYVDDGSSDGSFEKLREVAAKDSAAKVIRFRRNYGQTAGISAGIDRATGQTIVLMDADLQNDPQDIPRLVAKMGEGYDVVSGWRKDRQDALVTRKLPSWIANWLISVMTGVHLHDYGCTLKAYRADLIKNVRLYGEMHRFIPAYVAQEGARIAEMVVTHHARHAGESKYGLSRTFKVVLDLLVVKFLWGFATKPIHLFGSIGVFSCLGGMIAGAVALYEKWALDVYAHRNPLVLLAAFLFLLGVQCILMGLLAELLMRTYHESQHKTTYSIAECLNFDRAQEVKLSLLKLLICPGCHAGFSSRPATVIEDEIIEGSLVCEGCGATYPVIGGVPRILPAEMIAEQQRTAGAFGWEWTRFSKLHDLDLYIEQFIDWIWPLTADDLKGRTVLDGGCGMGRFSAVASHLGAKEVVGIDISRAVDAAYANTRNRPNIHIVQADINALPFRKDDGDFDFVFSIGVLHHLPNPKAGFCALTRHLRRGGTIATWVYGYENNEWLVRYVNPIRLWFTSRMPKPALYVLSWLITVPLHLVLKLFYEPGERVRALGFLKRALPYKYLFWLSRFGFRHTHHVIFDHLVAPKADYLKHDEFAAWFAEAKLQDVKITHRNENGWRGYGRKPA